MPKATKESGSVVTGLITAMTQLPSGKIVAVDSSGGVYQRSTSGTWTKHGTILPDTAYGLIYNLQHDTIYIPGLSAMHSITNADGRFGGTFTPNSNVFSALVDKEATDSTNTYTTTTAINEAAAHKLSVVPTIEPMYSVKLWITTKGTGDVTVTMHDAANNTLATVTKTAAQLTNGALNEFVFTTPVRNTVKPNAATYHFHVTYSNAAGGTATTVGAATSSDLSTARYQTLANRLISPGNGFHPIYEFLQYYLILNERYLAAWEPISQSDPTAIEFNQHRLVFPSGYQGTSGATWTEYFAVGVEKRSSSSDKEFQDGKIFFWDGTATTYNFFIDVPEGAPYSLFSHKNVLYWIAGGSWWAWNGGLPVKISQIPFTDPEFTSVNTYMINNPHMMTVRNGILLAGFPSETSSTSIEHGVYSFGSRMRNYPESFGFSYSISTGTRTNGTLRLGAVRNFGDKLFISWRDGANYGVDKIDSSSSPAATATWESLIIDNGRSDKTKQATELYVDATSLPSGATITPKYKIDRGDWVNGDQITAGADQAKISINKRYKEIQVGFDGTATNTTPEVIGATFVWDDLSSEAD